MTAPSLALEDEQRVLLVLAKAPFPMKRRAIEEAAFGRNGHSVFPTLRALRALESGGYVVRAYDPNTGQFDRCYRVTAKGKAMAGVLAACGGEAS